jgi:hypothetical protein
MGFICCFRCFVPHPTTDNPWLIMVLQVPYTSANLQQQLNQPVALIAEGVTVPLARHTPDARTISLPSLQAGEAGVMVGCYAAQQGICCEWMNAVATSLSLYATHLHTYFDSSKQHPCHTGTTLHSIGCVAPWDWLQELCRATTSAVFCAEPPTTAAVGSAPLPNLIW